MGATPLMGFPTLGILGRLCVGDLEALRRGLEDVWCPHGEIHIAGVTCLEPLALSGHLHLVGQMSAEEPMRRARSRWRSHLRVWCFG